MSTRLVNCTRVQLKRLVFPIQNRYISNSRIAMAPTITDAITKDHRELEDYYNKDPHREHGQGKGPMAEPVHLGASPAFPWRGTRGISCIREEPRRWPGDG